MSNIIFDMFDQHEFVDRYLNDSFKAVDVIIPLINTNELFENNLYNFYKRIPINRLLIGNGGCTDGSIDIAKEFPRVCVKDHTMFKSQGYCIAKLIQEVETDYFIYLHADVYLPNNWFETMYFYKDNYDWFECYRRHTYLLDLKGDKQNKALRAYSGSQFGNTTTLKSIASEIDDDYLQRNEDIIIHKLVENYGGKYSRISDTYHHHQVMNRRGEKEPDFSSVTIQKKDDPEWQKRIHDMQARGLIKYCEPEKKYIINIVNNSLRRLNRLSCLNWNEFKSWVNATNPKWSKYIKKPKPQLPTVAYYLRKLANFLER